MIERGTWLWYELYHITFYKRFIDQKFDLNSTSLSRGDVIIWSILFFTLFWAGFFRVSFVVGGSKIGPFCLTLVRITLQILNFLRKYTHICSFRKYIFSTNNTYKMYQSWVGDDDVIFKDFEVALSGFINFR